MIELAATALSLGLAASPTGLGLPASPPEEITLRNGLQVDVVSLPGARLFALHGRIDAGPLYDPPDRPGLSAVATEWLAWPVMGEDVRSPVIRWTGRGATASPPSHRWLEFRATGWLGEEDGLMAVLAGRLSSAARVAQAGVAPELWKRFRAAAAGRARAADESVDGQLWARALAAFYPRGSTLALPPWGPSDGVAGGPQNLQDFLRAHVTTSRTRVVLAGDFDASTLRPRLERTLGRIPALAASSPVPPAVAPSGPERWKEVRLPRRNLRRNHLLVVCPGDRSRPTDRLASRALAFLLAGSGDSSRLGRQLVKPGLAFTVKADLAEDGVPGFLYVRTAATSVATAEVLARVQATFDDLVRGNVQAYEVEAFVARERAEEASPDPARRAERRLLERPGGADRPPVLSVEDVNDCARRLFGRGAPTAFVIGPGETPAR